MNTLVAYAGKSGTTATMAETIGAAFDGEVTMSDLKENDPKKGKGPNPSNFDRIVVGGAIYAGSVNKTIRAFCERHAEVLKEKKLGLFLCSLRQEDAEENFARNFPAEIRSNAAAEAWLGGRFVFSEHNFVIRGMMKKILESDEDVENLRPEEARRLAEALS